MIEECRVCMSILFGPIPVLLDIAVECILLMVRMNIYLNPIPGQKDTAEVCTAVFVDT